MLSPIPAPAATYNANDTASLQAAIASVNAGSGSDTINITGNITLTAELTAITKGVTITGNDNTISGNNQYRVLFVAAGSGSSVNISNVTLANGLARGGNGQESGGGGMGAGGGIFAMSGNVTLTDVAFSGNAAVGGNGSGGGGAGGGGGMGGSGGSGVGFGGAGGGLGANARGGDGANGNGWSATPGAGILPGGSGGNGAVAGGANGGGGGGGLGNAGGGGGLNGGARSGANGGSGGFGGGGGGGTYGGNGGFGGGGGGGQGSAGSSAGGAGGFGGGGGGNPYGGPAGPGGYGGGNGAGMNGGGGAGLGGNVFICTTAVDVNCSATLTISNTKNTTVNGSATGGSGGALGAGGAIFTTTNAVTNVSVAMGTTTTISGSISGVSDKGISLSGGGTLKLLNDANNFNGLVVSGPGTTVSGGAGASPGKNGSFGYGKVSLGDHTAVQFTTNGTFNNGFALTATPTIDTAGSTITLAGKIEDGGTTGVVDVIGGGTLILTNNTNSYSGGTIVRDNSNLSISNNAQLGSLAGGLMLGDATTGGTLLASETFSSARAVTLAAGGGTISAFSGKTLTLSGVIGGDDLKIGGSGTVTLTGANTYTGGTKIDGGALQIGNASTTGKILGGVNVGAIGAFMITNADTSGMTGIANTGTTYFDSTSSAGNLEITNDGTTIFLATSTAGTANVTNNGTLAFNTSSTAGGARIGNNNTLNFNNTSKAGGATITNRGAVKFDDNSTAENATIVNESGTGHSVVFSANSKAGAAHITNSSDLAFSGTSSAENATIVNESGTGHRVVFSGNSKAGAAHVTNNSDLEFSGTGSADNAEITNNLSLSFLEGSNGGNAVIINNGDLSFNERVLIGAASTAGSATITTNSGGTVRFFGNASGGNARFITKAGGTFDISNASTGTATGSIEGAGTHLLGSKTLTVGANNNSTEVGGGIEGIGGSLVKVGSGTLTLSGASTYTGVTTVSSGMLKGGAANSFAARSAFSVVGGATIDLGGTDQEIGSLSGDGIVTNGGANDAGLTAGGDNSSTAFSGIIKNGATKKTALTKAGTGTLTLTGANTYTGGTTISAGALVGDTTSLLGDILNNATLTFSQASSGTYAGAISGSGMLTKAGTGNLALTGTNTYTGGTTISGGALVVSSDANLGDFSGGLTLDGGTLQWGATFDLAAARNLTLTTNGGTVDTNTHSTTISGDVTGAGGLLKSGAGTLSMTGNSGYGGATTVDGGTLKITGTIANGDGYAGRAAGTDGEVLVAGNTAGWTNNGNLHVGYSGTGTLTISNGAAVSATNAYAGYDYGSSGTVMVTGDGSRLTNSGALYVGYLGTGKLTIADGGSVSSLSGGIGSQVGSSGTVLVTGRGSIWTNSDELDVGLLRSGELTIADGGTVSNTLGRIGDQPSGAGTVMVTGDGSTWANSNILRVGTSGSGTLTIQDGGTVSTTFMRIAQETGSIGTLNIGAAAGDTATRAGKLNAPVVNFGSGTGKIVFNHIETDYQFAPDISGNGSVEQIAGTTILGGTSTYTGATKVSGGKLLVNGSIASSNVTVDADATIGGNGTIGNTVVNGTLSAGNSPGTLTVAGDLTLGAGSTSLFELGAPGTVGGPLNDLVHVTGNLTLGGTLLTPGAVSGYYRLFNVDGTVSGSYSTLPASATIQTAIPHQVNLFIQNGNQIVQFWDGADAVGNGAVDGGAGTWSAGGTNWTGAPGAANFNDQWRGSVAVFTGTGGLVTVSGPVGFEGIQFTSDGYKLDGGDLTLTGDSANNSSASFVTVTGIGTTAEIASALTGAAGIGLDKFGSGTLILSGNNSYTGATTIKGGTLALKGSGSIANSSVVTVENGIFDISGVSTSGLTWVTSLAGTSSGTVRLGDTGLGITNGSTEFAGVITGDGQIDIGSGIQTLSGVNTYTGTTGISGTLALKGNGSISSSSFVMVSGTFDISQTTNGTSVRQLFGPSGYGVVALGSKTLTITDAGSSSNPFIGSIQDGGLGGGTGGGVTIARGASQYLSGVSTYTGTTTVDQGGSLWLVNNGGLSSSSSLVVNGLFDIAGSSSPSTFKSLSGSGEIHLGDHDLRITAANGTFSGAISECGIGCSPSSFAKLTLEGGTLTLSGANSYGGGTTVGRFGGSATTLIVTNNSAVGSGRVLLNDAGVFQAGADGLTFANRFEVSPSYGTIDTNGHTMTIAGVIADATDPGSLHKIGAGTLILTNDNTYGDGTVVEAGTLQLGNGGSTGSILGDVSLGGTLAFNRSNNYTFSGVISDKAGSHGKVVQNGSGVVVLEGANSYSGGTIFNKGTIAVASDGNLGDAAGGLTFDGGTLRYDAAFDLGAARAVTLSAGGGSFDSNGFAVGIASDITGSGGLTKTGVGTLTLSGHSSYSGATTVSQGTLKASTAHSFSARSAVSVATGASLDLGSLDQVIGSLSGAGNVVMGSGKLTVDQTGNSTFSGGLSGGGSFTKNGSGKLMLSGTSTYTGQTFVKQGTLSVNGSIASSSGITVETGGTLGGTGTLASVIVNNGGTLAPGNSIGTVTVAGNLVMGAGSTYAVELDPASADRTNVTGTANLSGGTVSTNYAAATYIQKTYTILNAQGGLGGTSFAGLTGTAPTGFKHKLAYDGSNAYLALDLDMREPGNPGDPGNPGKPGRPHFDPLNRNQRSVANAIVGYFDAKGGILAEFGALDSAGLSLASGEPAAGAISSGIQGSDQFLGLLAGEALAGRSGQGAAAGDTAAAFADEKTEADSDRPFAALAAKSDRLAGPVAKVFDSRWRGWGATYGGTSEIGGDGAAGSHDTDLKTFGLAGGIARKWDDATIGIALGGGSSDFHLADKLGSGSARFFNAGVFGRQEFGNAYVAAAAAYSFYDVETGRTVLGKSLSGDFNAHAFSGRIEAGYDFETSLATLTPYAAFQAIAYRMPGYAESGAGNFGLTYKGNTTTVTRTELGARLEHGIDLDNNATLTLTGRAALAINGGDSIGFVAGFQALPGTSFSIEGANPDRYSALLDAGIEYATANGFFAAASLQGEVSGNVHNLAGTAKLGLKW